MVTPFFASAPENKDAATPKAIDPFDALAAQVRSAEQRLKAWENKLDNPRFFRPVIKAEWDRAFDRREALKTRLCRMDRERFASLYPNEPNDR